VEFQFQPTLNLSARAKEPKDGFSGSLDVFNGPIDSAGEPLKASPLDQYQSAAEHERVFWIAYNPQNSFSIQF
jgi:hypothetical protein